MTPSLISPAASAAAASDRPPPLDPTTMALFADLDGTLAPIEDHPAKVVPDTDRTALLGHLATARAVVSGRGLADIDRFLDPCIPAVGAIPGLVGRTGGGRTIESAPAGAIDGARRRLQHLVVSRPGLWLEDKGVALALHYRS